MSWETATSEVASTEATHKRIISAPIFLIISFGAMMLPSDLDIL